MAQKDTTIHELSSKLEFNDSSTKKYAEQVRLHPTNKQTILKQTGRAKT